MALENKNTQLLGYYSHQSIISPEREEDEYRAILNNYKGFVINPSQHYNVPNPFEMNIYWRALQQVNFIIVSAVKGRIGRTSYYEVKQGLLQKIPVHEIYSVGRAFRFRKVVGIKVVSEKSLKRYGALISIPLK